MAISLVQPATLAQITPLSDVEGGGAQEAINALNDPITLLLGRMRAGDRAAAADFMSRYGSRIRRRVRYKLSRPMRRLFDSQEILSTVSRRLDQYVQRNRVEADSPEQLWALVFRMADHALVDKLRVFRRLESIEGSDTDFAQVMLSRLRSAEQSHAADFELELDRVFSALTDAVDRRILSLWLSGESHEMIAGEVGIAATGVRKRWQSIREHLRHLLETGAL